jgi:hypothetical protein
MTDTMSPPIRPGRGGPWLVPARLLGLYLRSRHVPGAVAIITVLGAFLWADLYWRWSVAGGPAAQQLVPLTVIAGVASAVGVATHGAFGESEQATGRWLPYLRLGSAALLAVVGTGALLAAANGGVLVAGDLALVRDLAGSIGIGLLTAAVLGGQFAWIGPVAYWLATESALAAQLSPPYLWPTRPPHDTAALVCAIVVTAAGLVAVTARPATPPQRLT